MRGTASTSAPGARGDSRGPGRPGRRRGRRHTAAHPRVHERAAALYPPAGPPDPACGWRVLPRGRAAGESPAPERGEGTGEERASPGQRLRLAVAERMPGWLGARCGVEPRSVAALGVLLLVGVGFAVHQFATGRPHTVAASSTATPAASGEGVPIPTADPTPIVVDVAGDVAEPGVHTLPPDSRVEDAVRAAGGLLPGAGRPPGLNQARPLSDGELIVVGGPSPTAPHASGITSDGRVRLNAATARQLQELPGIGPVLARNILGHRERHGDFRSLGDLRDVPGIGERRLAELRDLVVP